MDYRIFCKEVGREEWVPDLIGWVYIYLFVECPDGRVHSHENYWTATPPVIPR